MLARGNTQKQRQSEKWFQNKFQISHLTHSFSCQWRDLSLTKDHQLLCGYSRLMKSFQDFREVSQLLSTYYLPSNKKVTPLDVILLPHPQYQHKYNYSNQCKNLGHKTYMATKLLHFHPHLNFLGFSFCQPLHIEAFWTVSFGLTVTFLILLTSYLLHTALYILSSWLLNQA